MRKRIVAVTGAAPYLGGDATWAHLRAAAPEFDFTILDPLDMAGVDFAADLRAQLGGACATADLLLAHGTAARAAIEDISGVEPSFPIVLISPMLLRRDGIGPRAVRLSAGAFGGAFASAARVKLRRLRADPERLRRELMRWVLDSAINADLLVEARTRIEDARCDTVVERTGEVVRALLEPLDPRHNAVLDDSLVLCGESALDDRIARRMKSTRIPGAGSAAMLEAPAAVAEHLRSILA